MPHGVTLPFIISGELSLEHARGWMGTSTYFIRLTKSDTPLSSRYPTAKSAIPRNAGPVPPPLLFSALHSPAVITVDHWDEEE